jgi:glycosyltransferase involved in cell wall biosynthesis
MNIFNAPARPSAERRIWISWEGHRRTRELCRALDVRLFEFTGRRSRAVKYFGLLWRTALCLAVTRPRTLFVQCPSIVLAAFAAGLRPFVGYRLVVDLHNAAVEPEGPSRLHRAVLAWIHRRASLNLVSNAALAPMVERDGGAAFVLPDRVPGMRPFIPASVKDRIRIVFVCSYATDEPYRAVIDAARLLPPSWIVFVTGDERGLEPAVRRAAPANVQFTGFLAEAAYERLLASADVVVDLTSREDCLVCGAYEAVALEKPLVTSDTRALREYFRRGAVYSAHDPASLAAAMTEAVLGRERLAQDMASLKAELTGRWNGRRADLELWLDRPLQWSPVSGASC